MDNNEKRNNDINGYSVTPGGDMFEKDPPVSAVEINDDSFVDKVFDDQVVSEPSFSETTDSDIDSSFNFEPQFIPSGNYGYNKKSASKGGRGTVFTVILCSVLSALIAVGCSVGVMYSLNKNEAASGNISGSSENTVVTKINVSDATATSVAEAVAAKAGPSVVGIRTTAAVTSFFGGSQDSTDEGSGIIYSTDGYIITNYHVISSAVESSKSKIEVFLESDNKNGIEATVVGYNISSDLAVIKIAKTGLTAIELGDSSALKVGQYAVAIGSPGGLEFINSVSYGIISGLNREISTSNGTVKLIQTDAAINPGNSGGALLNTEGKLIGVNSAKLVDTSFENMGFAIPVNTVKEICDKIIARQNSPTPYIGIEISHRYSANTLSSLGYPEGAVVNSVSSGGPAAESGIKRGDIITEFNGKTITSYTELEDAIKDTSPGSSVTVKIYRSGRFYSTTIKVASNNEQ